MRTKMEDSVCRRLDSLSRHFLIRREPNQALRLNSSSALDEFRSLGSDPVIVGGMVLDIHATPFTSAHPRTTTPGKEIYCWNIGNLLGFLQKVTFTSPNEDELISMANALLCENGFSPIKSLANGGSKQSTEQLFQMLKPAILVLLEKGVKIVIVTVGADGVFVCSKGDPNLIKNHLKNTKPSNFGRRLYEIIASTCPSDKFVIARKFKRSSHPYVVHFPSLPASVVRLTGAGDSLVGGTLSSMCAGMDLMQSMAVGIAAAKATVEVETNVPFEYSLDRITEDARIIYSMAKVLCDQPLL